MEAWLVPLGLRLHYLPKGGQEPDAAQPEPPPDRAEAVTTCCPEQPQAE